MIITFPSGLYVSILSWGLKTNDITYRSSFGAQSVKASAPMWVATVELDKINENLTGQYQALILKLRGSQNQLAMWNFARPEPLGTMRGTLTMNASHSAGDTTLNITGGVGQANKTLKAGDLLGFGTGTTQHLVMVVDDATANGSGVISVTIEPPLRDDFSSSTAVEWDKPKALFRLNSDSQTWTYESVFAQGFSLDLIEDVRI